MAYTPSEALLTKTRSPSRPRSTRRSVALPKASSAAVTSARSSPRSRARWLRVPAGTHTNGTVVPAGDVGDQGLRPVAPGHPDHVGARGDGLLGERREVVTALQDHRLDPPPPGLVLQVEPGDLPTARPGVHQQDAAHRGRDGQRRRRCGGEVVTERHPGGGGREQHQSDDEREPQRRAAEEQAITPASARTATADATPPGAAAHQRRPPGNDGDHDEEQHERQPQRTREQARAARTTAATSASQRPGCGDAPPGRRSGHFRPLRRPSTSTSSGRCHPP